MPKKKSRRPAARPQTRVGRPSTPHRTAGAGPLPAGLAAVREAAKGLLVAEPDRAGAADGPAYDSSALTVTRVRSA